MPNSPHALVTGSSSGIGHAITQALLAAGWRVTGFDRSRPTFRHASFTAVEIDLLDAAATDEATRKTAGVTAFVHAAGVLRVGTLGILNLSDGELTRLGLGCIDQRLQTRDRPMYAGDKDHRRLADQNDRHEVTRGRVVNLDPRFRREGVGDLDECILLAAAPQREHFDLSG